MNQQRKGQWLWNQISMKFHAKDEIENNAKVAKIMWNMTDKEFDGIMKQLEKEKKQ